MAVADYIAFCDSDSVGVNIITNDFDIDGDGLYLQTIYSTTDLTNLSIASTNVTVRSNAAGTDTLIYIVCDSIWNTCDTGEVVVTVIPCSDSAQMVNFQRRRGVTTANGRKISGYVFGNFNYPFSQNSQSSLLNPVKSNGNFKPFAFVADYLPDNNRNQKPKWNFNNSHVSKNAETHFPEIEQYFRNLFSAKQRQVNNPFGNSGRPVKHKIGFNAFQSSANPIFTNRSGKNLSLSNNAPIELYGKNEFVNRISRSSAI